MFWKRKRPSHNQHLDRVGRVLVRAAAASDQEAEAAVSSPFFLAQLRARIADEEKRRTEPAYRWFAMMPVARRVISTLTLIAMAAAATFWFTRSDAPPADPFNSTLVSSSNGVAATACAVATKEECAVSTDEVLALLVSKEEQR